jgi:hypothetical protein
VIWVGNLNCREAVVVMCWMCLNNLAVIGQLVGALDLLLILKAPHDLLIDVVLLDPNFVANRIYFSFKVSQTSLYVNPDFLKNIVFKILF